MDADELDAWLGEVEDDDEERVSLWSDTASDAADHGDRSRWQRLAAAGVALLVLAIAGLVVVGGRGSPPVDAMGIPEVLPEPAVPEDRAQVQISENPEPVVSPEEGNAGEVSQTMDGQRTPSPVTWPGDDPQRRSIEVAAALVVREHLVADQAQPGAFVERLEAVDLQPLDDRVGVVTIDAVWLTQVDGVYDRAVRAQFATPVSIDGTPLAGTWMVAVPTVTAPMATTPPTGLERGQEAVLAMEIAGWSAVDVHACQPHPDLPGVWQALVDGVDPSGRAVAGQLLWLHDIDGFSLAGVTS